MAIQINKAIFLHIPKTGGTWVTEYFKEVKMDHEVADLGFQAHINGKVIDEMRPDTKDLVFCFVRHPLTWYRSYWQMKKDLVPERRGGVIDLLIDQPFHSFIREVIEKYPNGYLTDFFHSYTFRCHCVGKMENLREDLEKILEFLRIPYNKPHLHGKKPSNTHKSDQKYTYELAVAVMKSERELTRLYKYDYLPIGIIE